MIATKSYNKLNCYKIVNVSDEIPTKKYDKIKKDSINSC